MPSDSNGPAQALASVERSGTLRGILIGLIPLALLVGIIIITLALTALFRQLVAASGFFVEQQADLIILIAGFVLGIVVYAVAIWRTLRQVATWQRDGRVMQARSALLALGITSLIVLLPLLLALVLPQHPAP